MDILHMEDKKLISKLGIFFDLIVTLIFGIFITLICSHHAPPLAQTSTRYIVGFFAAIPVTTTFWLGITLFRITLVDMLRTRQEKRNNIS